MLEILTSYFLLLWSEWIFRDDSSTLQTQISIREDFVGIGLERNSKELVERLDRIPEELNREAERFRKYRPLLIGNPAYFARNEYRLLRDTLLEVENETTNDPACASPKSILFTVMLIPVDFYRILLDICLHSAPFPPIILLRSVAPSHLHAGFHLANCNRFTLAAQITVTTGRAI